MYLHHILGVVRGIAVLLLDHGLQLIHMLSKSSIPLLELLNTELFLPEQSVQGPVLVLSRIGRGHHHLLRVESLLMRG
jgi:hypothetical protein